MNIVIVDTYYPAFLKAFVRDHPEIKYADSTERHSMLMSSRFAESDSYSHYLITLGHSAIDIVANANFIQEQWATENGLARRPLEVVLVERIRALRPDVLYMRDISYLSDNRLRELRAYVRLIVGQIAAPLPRYRDLSCFDLIMSSLPNYVRFFRNIGIPSERLRLAFDPRVLPEIPRVSAQESTPICFVGGVSGAHKEGTRLLEAVANELPLAVWGYGAGELPRSSPLRAVHRGSAWALDMYRVLSCSKIAINRHIDIAGPYAANLRLYEATGVGTCLVTDAKDNLGDLFALDQEVVTYASPAECVVKCSYLLEHERERAAIALAGQRRTLGEHTWFHRMQELELHLQRSLQRPRQLSPRTFIFESASTPRGQVLTRLRGVAKNLPGQHILRSAYHRLPSSGVAHETISSGYKRINRNVVSPHLSAGWKAPDIAAKQRGLVDLQLLEMYQGQVHASFRAAADAVQATGVANGLITEVGCASGYYYEVLEHLLKHNISYTGIDYSESLIALARKYYPEATFAVGDATELPMAAESCDVLLSGCVLLHVPNYAKAIQESARVARRWCIFHRTPVTNRGSTQYFSKYAYGNQVMEVVFSESELLDHFQQVGLKLHTTIQLGAGSLPGNMGNIRTTTYVCEKG